MTDARSVGPSVFALAAILLLSACGDDGVDPARDGSPGDSSVASDGSLLRSCPMGPTPEQEQLGACCYHASNADRLDAPELRVAAMEFSAPASLANLFIASLLGNAIDQERFNWIFALGGADADGPIAVRTGGALRQDDGSYAFANGDAPAPGDAARWDPTTVQGSITGETWHTEEPSDTFVLPVEGETPGALAVELPFRNLVVDIAVLSNDRSCIGERFVSSYDTSEGSLRAFMTVEAALAAPVVLGPDNTTTLCAVVANLLTRPEGCSLPRSEWGNPPDALCEGGGCTANTEGMTDACDPMTECNAWTAEVAFAAHGVELR